jgi:hypothetical protein
MYNLMLDAKAKAKAKAKPDKVDSDKSKRLSSFLKHQKALEEKGPAVNEEAQQHRDRVAELKAAYAEAKTPSEKNVILDLFDADKHRGLKWLVNIQKRNFQSSGSKSGGKTGWMTWCL